MTFLQGTGYIFDTVLDLSIKKDFVDQSFVDTSWKVIRDFSNMLFIFILLYTGISKIIGIGKDWREVVLKVVVIALLINFSLFFTKVVIDAGNVLAVGVRDSIQAGGSLSYALATKFQPQSFITAGGNAGTENAIVIFLIATVVSGFAGYVFFKAALLFLGRLIAFWFLMIISPFAFISMALPKGNIFTKWLDTLTKQTFMAPLFLFLVYLILQIINVPGGILGGITTPGKGDAIFSNLFAPIIIAVFLLLALKKALSLATDLAGDFGAATSAWAGKAMGLAGGVALGGAALAGRATVGRLAQNLQEKGTFQRMATNTTDGNIASRFLGRQMLTVNDKARTGTWDVRGADGFIGKNINKGISSTLGDTGKVSPNAKGGFEGATKRQDAKDLEMAKKLRMTDDEKKVLEDKYEVGEKKMRMDEEKKNMEKKAEEVATAEENAKNSITGQAVTSAEVALKEQKEETEKATKEREDAEKAHTQARNSGRIDPALQKALDDARIKEGSSLASLTQAQNTFDSAEVAHKTSTEMGILAGAQAEFSVAKNAAEATKKIADKAVEDAKKEIANENKKRNEVYADYVEGRVKTVAGLGIAATVVGGLTQGLGGAAVGAGVSNLTYSQKQARATAAKIRTGAGPDESEKDMSKLVKELSKKMKEEEENKK